MSAKNETIGYALVIASGNGITGFKRYYSENGKNKLWPNLSQFARFLSSYVSKDQYYSRAPSSLFENIFMKFEGANMVAEVSQDFNKIHRLVSIDTWYEEYWRKSEKFAAARKSSLSLSKNAKTLIDSALPKTSAVPLSPYAVNTNNQKSFANSDWSQNEKQVVQRALTLAARFVPNIAFQKFDVHPKNSETYAVIEISGTKYALLKI